MKYNIQLVQTNSSYGNQYFIPYSVGLLQSYVNQFDEIKENFNFLKFIYKQEKSIDEQITNMGKIDIVAQSCYMWNWKFNLTFAEKIKQHNPNCVVILGGPQIPDIPDDFFEEHPFVDILCHGEGELVFHEILKQYLGDRNYGEIEGVSYHNTETSRISHVPRRPRAIELNEIPSPYLDGTFSELLDEDVVWQVSWETNRGCPYRCSFCVWGSEYFNKIRKFPLEERLLKEVDWFSENKIGLVFGCDANFGVFKRDVDIASALVAAKEKTGYPIKFRVCNAKNSNEAVYQISEILNNAEMAKGTSMSVQSMNEDVLDAIKRKNIGMDKFKDLMNRFNKSSIPTYTEIILPLPNETKESFMAGLDMLLWGGQHSQINIYNCTILENSEMGSKNYIEEHGIKTIEVPVFQAHVDKTPYEQIQETEHIVIETKTMPQKDWIKSFQYSWAIQAFHTLGLLQYVAIVLANKYSCNYSDFYGSLIEYAEKNPESLFGTELAEINNSINNILAGQSHGQDVLEYELDIVWPPEEATLLRILNKINLFYYESADFIRFFADTNGFILEDEFLDELLWLQKEIIVQHKDDNEFAKLRLNYNFVEFVDSVKNGISENLIKFPTQKEYRISKPNNFFKNKKDFARQVVWYGRKGGKYLNEKIEELS
jgi:putative methyltransferase